MVINRFHAFSLFLAFIIKACMCMSTCIFVIGERYSSMNLHGLIHLPDVVKSLGPLWAHSCFPFESANGEMLKLFHGTTCVEKQVYISYVL